VNLGEGAASCFDSLPALRAGLAAGLPHGAAPCTVFATNATTLFLAAAARAATGFTAYVARAAPEACSGGAKEGCANQTASTLANLAGAAGEGANQLNRHVVEVSWRTRARPSLRHSPTLSHSSYVNNPSSY
jgi:hypothetical protein